MGWRRLMWSPLIRRRCAGYFYLSQSSDRTFDFISSFIMTSVTCIPLSQCHSLKIRRICIHAIGDQSPSSRFHCHRGSGRVWHSNIIYEITPKFFFLAKNGLDPSYLLHLSPDVCRWNTMPTANIGRKKSHVSIQNNLRLDSTFKTDKDFSVICIYARAFRCS